jgi:hypothetical protein
MIILILIRVANTQTQRVLFKSIFITNNCVKQKQDKIISNPVGYRYIHISLYISIMHTLKKMHKWIE